METIKRKIETSLKESNPIKRIGFSDNNVLTLVLLNADKKGNEIILNFDEKELKKLKNFLSKII